jgi:hypothetical protein
MPLINCPDCGKEISAQAKACPNCARPLTTQNLLKKDLGVDGWLFGMITVTGFFIGLSGVSIWGWLLFGIGLILIFIKLLKGQ